HFAAAALVLTIQTPAISHIFSMKVHSTQDTLVLKSLEWLKEYDEKRSGVKDYSVIAPWHYGHLITYMTGIPNVANNFFGIPVHDRGIAEGIRFFFTLDRDEVKEIINNRKIRYIFMTPTPKEILKTYFGIAGLDEDNYYTEKGELKVEYTQTMEYQLGVFNGSKIPFVKLIYEDRSIDESGKTSAHVKIFEIR
ncbi:MAG: hypothetical protein FJ088_14145, partial [Deltaproteobacteria bacterium]|nr:hypothetical protein [Deltaproteobacteria bacterium]